MPFLFFREEIWRGMVGLVGFKGFKTKDNSKESNRRTPNWISKNKKDRLTPILFVVHNV